MTKITILNKEFEVGDMVELSQKFWDIKEIGYIRDFNEVELRLGHRDRGAITAFNEFMVTIEDITNINKLVYQTNKNYGDSSLGQSIREARVAKGMTQAELGSLLGYSAMAISHFEKGNRAVSKDVFTKLVPILGMKKQQYISTSTRVGVSARNRSLKP